MMHITWTATHEGGVTRRWQGSKDPGQRGPQKVDPDKDDTVAEHTVVKQPHQRPG